MCVQQMRQRKPRLNAQLRAPTTRARPRFASHPTAVVRARWVTVKARWGAWERRSVVRSRGVQNASTMGWWGGCGVGGGRGCGLGSCMSSNDIPAIIPPASGMRGGEGVGPCSNAAKSKRGTPGANGAMHSAYRRSENQRRTRGMCNRPVCCTPSLVQTRTKKRRARRVQRVAARRDNAGRRGVHTEPPTRTLVVVGGGGGGWGSWEGGVAMVSPAAGECRKICARGAQPYAVAVLIQQR